MKAADVAFTSPSTDGDAAIALAFDDVRAAFAEFRRRTAGRPFVVAAHSQGAVLGARLVREVIAPTNERPLLVAAYLIGAPLRAGGDVGDLPPCATSTSTGCIVAYNARLAGHTPQPIDFGANVPEKDRLCVNPTTGSVTSTTATTLEHGGAVFFDSAHPRVLPRFLSSSCRDGRLVVSDLQPLPRRGPLDAILLAMLGGTNLHPIEYQLFFMDLRRDLGRRVAAFNAVAR